MLSNNLLSLILCLSFQSKEKMMRGARRGCLRLKVTLMEYTVAELCLCTCVQPNIYKLSPLFIPLFYIHFFSTSISSLAPLTRPSYLSISLSGLICRNIFLFSLSFLLHCLLLGSPRPGFARVCHVLIWGHTFDPTGFAKLRHVTISMHVHVTHLHCLLCF